MSIAQRSAVTTWEVRWPPAADRSSMTRALGGDVTWATRTGARDGMTSPEELAAAVDASCFAMALVLRLGEGGAVPQGLRVEATVALDEVDGVPTIISSHLVVRARVTGFDGDRFQRAVDEAVALCPISLVPWCPGAQAPLARLGPGRVPDARRHNRLPMRDCNRCQTGRLGCHPRGSGGVGVMVVQLALSRGASVIVTASQDRHARLRELGAAPTEYGPGVADRIRAIAPGGVDAALIVDGTREAVDVSIELLADTARIAAIAGSAEVHRAGIQTVSDVQVRDVARMDLVNMADHGALRVIVSHAFPLANVASAHRAISTGHTIGKIALTLQPASGSLLVRAACG